VSRPWGLAPALLWMGIVAACQPTAPVRECTGCTYDFADTIPPDTLVFHWPAARLPVRFYADPRGAMPALVALGVAAWEGQFLYGEFHGIQTPDSNRADIIVEWDAGVPADVAPDPGPPVDACGGATTNPTVVFTDSSASVLHVRLGPKGGSFTAPQVAACLRRIVIHEIGHALGLLKHSPSPFDIMNQTPTVTLPSSADRRTVEVLYHTAATVVPPPR
jgi:hypothetical protein